MTEQRVLIGTGTTDSNGVASITMNGFGSGEADIIAVSGSLESNECQVLDTILHDEGLGGTHNDIWAESATGALTRSIDYSVLKEIETGTNVYARVEFNLRDTVIEFDAKVVDGANINFVRVTQGNNNIFEITEPTTGNWHHYKIVVDSTTNYKLYKDDAVTPIIGTIRQSIDWSNNIKFHFWTTDSTQGNNTEIDFKNFRVYPL